MRARAPALVLLAAAAVVAQAPPGFKTYENKLAPLTFHYPTIYKEVPLPPTEQLLVARFVLDRTPRALRDVDERVLARAQLQLHVFLFEDASAPVTGGGEREPAEGDEPSGPATIREAMEAKSRVGSWQEFVARLPLKLAESDSEPEPDAEPLAFEDRKVGASTLVGYLVHKRVGSKVFGAYAWTLEPHRDRLLRLMRQVGKSLELSESDGSSELVERRIERIYRNSDLRGVEWRKRIRRGLAKGWKAVDSENYLIVHHARNERLIDRIAKELEAMRSFYAELFPPRGDIDRVSVLRLCETKEEYHQYGGRPGTGGYWHAGNEELVLFDYSYTQRTLTPEQKKRTQRRLTSADTFLVMRHEAFHQYIFYAIGEVSPHDWFNEGYGDYFSGAVVSHNTARVRRIEPSSWRVERAKQMCGGGKNWLPLKKILEAERAVFYNRARVADYYAGAWSFVYFLKHADVVREHARWAGLLDTYFDEIKAGYVAELATFGDAPTLQDKMVAGAKARKRAMQRTLEGVDLDALEQAWKQFVVDL